jgi:Spy/CpxP family protein refolding chaperone
MFFKPFAPRLVERINSSIFFNRSLEMKKMIFGTVIILALAFASLTAANYSEGCNGTGGPGIGGEGRGGGQGMHKMGGHGMGKMGPQLPGARFYENFAEELNLSEEQLDKIGSIQNKNEKEMLDRKQEIERLMLDVRNQMDEDYDRAKIEPLMQKVIELKSNLQILSLNYKLDLLDVLTDDQRTKMKKLAKDKRKNRMKQGRKGKNRNRN